MGVSPVSAPPLPAAPSRAVNLISFLHPTPAVGGVPSEPALTFLREHEGFDRGWYAGPIGWLDAERNGEFMVALRSGVIQGREAALFAGCGLVADSDSEKEYQETQLKLLTSREIGRASFRERV